MTQKKSKTKNILLATPLLLIILLIVAYRYLTFSLPADQEALLALTSTDTVKVVDTASQITFNPLNKIPTVGLIYYPGGQVAPESFAYAAKQMAQEGYFVVIEKMPFNLAFFGKDKAFDTVSSYPEIKSWYLSGFSLGGVAASMALSTESSSFDGLILYGSYSTKNYDLSSTPLNVLSLSGSNDGLSTPDKIQNAKMYLPKDTTFIEIEGANHTQFAIYGEGQLQKGDGVSDITRMEQQKIIIEETLNFLEKNQE